MKSKQINQSIHFDGKGVSHTVKLKKRLGAGAFAEVFLTDNPDYVVKVINMASPKILASYRNEKYVYTTVEKHPNLVFCYNFKEENNFSYLLLENCSHGTLFDLISSYQDKTLPESLILQIIYEITTALHKLHSCNPPIIHRDIKIENVLIGIDGNLKICDFGSMTTKKYPIVNEKNRTAILEDIENNTTPIYRSPEQSDLYLGYEINEKVDVWALGCVLFMLCYQKPPFESRLATLNDNLAIPKTPQYSDRVLSLFQKIFVQNPKQRVSIVDLLNTLQNSDIQQRMANNKQIMTTINKSPKQVRPNFFALINKHIKRLTTKSEGWLLSAIEQNEEGPKQKYVRYLIIKAWQRKKSKIEKFYRFISNNSTKYIDNTVVTIKILIVLHNYFKKGPIDVFVQPNENFVISIVKQISDHWKDICERQNFQGKDQRRTPYFSHIIYKYAATLHDKVKLHLENIEIFEGNFSIAPLTKKKPKNTKFFNTALLDKLLKYLRTLSELNSLFLQNNSLWKIQTSMIFSLMDEEYCLICLLVHMIYALQCSTNHVSEAKVITRDNVLLVRMKFRESFQKIMEFFNKVKSMKEFSEIYKLIPNLNGNVLNFLEKQDIFQNSNSAPFELLSVLSYNNKIVDLKIPLSYGLSVQISEKNNFKPDFKKEDPNPEFEKFSKPLDQSKKPINEASERNPLKKSSIKQDMQDIILFDDAPLQSKTGIVEKKSVVEDFDFDFNFYKKSNPEYQSLGPSKQQDYAEDQIYPEFSHQDYIFQDHTKGLAEVFDIKANNPSFEVPFGENQQANYFNNLPNHFFDGKFQDTPNKNNDPFNEIPKQTNNVNYAQFFDDDLNKAPFKNENENESNKFYNKEAENAFANFKNEFSPFKSPPSSPPNRKNKKEKKNEKEKDKEKEAELIALEVSNSCNLEDLKPISNQMKEFLKDHISKDIEDWFIDYKTLSFDKIIGTGSSSEVFLGKWNNMDVAIKKVKVVLSNLSSFQEFQREISTLMKLKPHQNLLTLLGISYNEFEVFIITEFCFGGTLFELLHRKIEIALDWKLRLKYIKDIARGIEYLHGYIPPLIHRDLKSLNLLISQEDFTQATIKIADFGLARIFQTTDIGKMTGITGTFHWMAPEIFENKPYSLKADVYSFGIVLWEICARETPYKDLKGPHAIMKLVTIDQGRPDLSKIHKECPIQLIEIMKKCWSHDPEFRPSMGEVVCALEAVCV